MTEKRPVSNWLTSRVAVVSLGLVLSMIVGGLTLERQSFQLKKRFQAHTERTFHIIFRNLTTADAMLEALVGLNLASDEMEPSLFAPFSESILQSYPYIKSIQYVSAVDADDREDFIEEMQQQGFSQFTIQDVDDSQPLEVRSTYLVTSFIEPMTPSTARLMGMEWSANHQLRGHIERAVKSDRLALLPAPEVLRPTGQLVLLKPTYYGRNKSHTARQRMQQFSGLFMMLVDWYRLSERSAPTEQTLDVAFDLLPHARNDNSTADFLSANGLLADQRQLTVGGQEITISASNRTQMSAEDFSLVVLPIFLFLFIYLVFVLLVRKRYQDQRARARVQQQLYSERELAQVTLQSIDEAVITLDVNQSVNYLNSVAEKLLRCSSRQAVGRPVRDLIRLMDLTTSRFLSDPVGYFFELAKGERTLAQSEVVLHIDGATLSVDGRASPLKDSSNNVIGSVLVIRDVSLERQLTNELVYQASHDALTGLVNRMEFEKKLKEMLEHSRQKDSQHALCYLDMDQFKLINDTCGHIAGDELLKQVAGLLLFQMREDDLVARLGGDEFGVLIRYCNQQMARDVAERVRQSLSDYHFTWQDKIFDVSASIGLVMINRLSGSLSDLLSSADLACYAAKDSGRNVVHLYRSDDEEIATKFSQMQWLPRIREALHNNEFTLALQPIQALKKGLSPSTIYEFLLRWPQHDGSSVSPALFIPSAERYDLMRELDRWVINHALSLIPQLERHLPNSGEHLYTINLSGQSVGDPDLTHYIINTINNSGVAPELICFEITETVAIANFSTASDFIQQLRDQGCRFALDDFGSGLSSFAYLKRLPLDYLKIDGLFIRDMMKDPVDLAMVKTIHDVARVLKLKTIAEWVEDEQVFQSLNDIGVDYAQGHYIETPRPFAEYLSKR